MASCSPPRPGLVILGPRVGFNSQSLVCQHCLSLSAANSENVTVPNLRLCVTQSWVLVERNAPLEVFAICADLLIQSRLGIWTQHLVLGWCLYESSGFSVVEAP